MARLSRALEQATVIVCSRGKKEKPVCRACSKRSTASCQYDLRGIKQGSKCGILLCARCADRIDGVAFCQTHASIKAREDKEKANGV